MQEPAKNATAPRSGANPAQAHLLIHAGDAGHGGSSRLEAHWQRLIAFCVQKPPSEHERDRLLVEIHDMHGNEVAAFDDAGALLDIALPEGTYRVTTRRGLVRRAYTMTLKAGGVFDLYLRLPPCAT